MELKLFYLMIHPNVNNIKTEDFMNIICRIYEAHW